MIAVNGLCFNTSASATTRLITQKTSTHLIPFSLSSAQFPAYPTMAAAAAAAAAAALQSLTCSPVSRSSPQQSHARPGSLFVPNSQQLVGY